MRNSDFEQTIVLDSEDGKKRGLNKGIILILIILPYLYGRSLVSKLLICYIKYLL